MKSQLIQLLKLSSDATEEQIVSAVVQLKREVDSDCVQPKVPRQKPSLARGEMARMATAMGGF